MPKDLFENSFAGPKDLLADQNTQPIQTPITRGDKLGNAIVNNPITSAGMAIIGGLAEGGADIAQGIGDTPTFIMDKLGLISPETAKKLYAANKENTDFFRPNYNPGDVLSQTKKDNPIISGGSKLATDIAGMTGVMRAVPLLGQGLETATSGLNPISPYIAQGAGMAGRALGMGAIGAAGANPEDKNSSFLLSAAMQPMFEAGGAALFKALSPRATAILRIQQQAISNKAETKNINALYDKIKKAPFTQEDSSQIYQLVRKAEDVLVNNPNLSAQQKSILQDDLIKKLGSAVNHSDVLDVYKDLGAKNSAFKGYSSAIYDIYKSARDEIGSMLQNATKRTGEVDDVLSKASEAANKQRILNETFGNIIENPETFNPKAASNRLVKEINDLVKNQANPELIQSMRGLNRVLKEIPKAPYVSPQIGAMIGAPAGYAVGNGLGAAAGAAGGAGLAAYFNRFVRSEQGLKFLGSLAKPGVQQQDVRNVVKALSISAAEWEKNKMMKKMAPEGATPMPDGPVLTTGIR